MRHGDPQGAYAREPSCGADGQLLARDRQHKECEEEERVALTGDLRQLAKQRFAADDEQGAEQGARPRREPLRTVAHVTMSASARNNDGTRVRMPRSVSPKSACSSVGKTVSDSMPP